MTMIRARRREQWGHTSQLLYLLNLSAQQKYLKARVPDDFNPTIERPREQAPRALVRKIPFKDALMLMPVK